VGRNMSKSENIRGYEDVCGLRMLYELGCSGCVLDGTVGCHKTGGKGNAVSGLSIVGGKSGGGRTLDGYVCHIQNFKF
jgi:hypothetical protein